MKKNSIRMAVGDDKDEEENQEEQEEQLIRKDAMKNVNLLE